MSSALSTLSGFIGGGVSISGIAVRHTQLTILINGQNLSSLFPPINEITLRYEDEISFQADNLELICPDIGDQLINNPLVKKGNSLRCIIDVFNADYFGSHTQLDTGEFDIDQIRQTGPPTQLTLLGTSVPIGSHIKMTLQNRVVFATTVQSLADGIAKENGLQLVWQVTDAARDQPMEQADQHHESDLAFLARMCKERGLGMKIANHFLYIFDEQAKEMAAPVYVLDFANPGTCRIEHWALDTRSQDIYSRATFAYVNPPTGQAAPITLNLPETQQSSASGESLNNWDFPLYGETQVEQTDV